MTTAPRRPALSRRTLLASGFAATAGIALRDPLGRALSTLGDATGLTGVATAAITPATQPLLDGITAWVDSIQDLVPGCSVASLDLRAGAEGTYAVGHRDEENGLPFLPSTIALIDSVTKQFTATMLAQAVSGGLGWAGPITLESPIGSSLAPYVAQYGHPPMADITAGITLRQLADYTSGFYEKPFNETDPPTYSLNHFTEWLSQVRAVGQDKKFEGLAFTPGSAYLYSDVAADLLGFILSDQIFLSPATSPGMPLFVPLLQELITGPGVLDMPDTVIVPPPSESHRVAVGYLYDQQPPNPTFTKATKINAPPEFGGGGGNLRSTAEDMLRFLHAILDPPATQFLDQAVPLTSQVYWPGPGSVTGLGWDPIKQGEATVFMKNGGGSAGTTAMLGYSPQTQRALFFVANVGFGEGTTHVAEAFTELLTQISPLPPTTTSTSTTDPAAATPTSGARAATPVVARPSLAG